MGKKAERRERRIQAAQQRDRDRLSEATRRYDAARETETGRGPQTEHGPRFLTEDAPRPQRRLTRTTMLMMMMAALSPR